MSILDDAIRQHLELKRAHGADESELKKLEDEAFGPPGRPEEQDPMAEAPTEFLAAPDFPEEEPGDEGTRRLNLTDLQEPPAPPSAPEGDLAAPEPSAPEPSAGPEAPPAEPEPGEPESPSEEEHPAIEHEAISDPGPGTEERPSIADQPTQFFDVEAEIGSAAEAPSPSDEELADAEQAEPRLSSSVDQPTEVHPAPPAPDEEGDEDPAAFEEEEAEAHEDDFFSEQRLSDELDQALEAPLTEEHEAPPAPEPVQPQGPATEEHSIFDSDQEKSGGDGGEREGEKGDGEPEAPTEYEPEADHEDVLEDTPEFLEESEDEELWFEQQPPKDFDFDD